MQHSKLLDGIKILTEKTDNLYLENALPAKNIRIEYPCGRTYGECILEEMMSIRMINGDFYATLHIKDKPKRLRRDEALNYYTNKLRTIWDSLNT
jgi:hypothetical protein